MQENNQQLQIYEEINNLSKIKEEIDEAFKDIPFGNTDFQIENFIVKASGTPSRAYRQLGLEIHKLINGLRDGLYNWKKEDIDIMELEDKIKNPETSKYDKMRAELEIARIKSKRVYEEKLARDSLHALFKMYEIFKQLPKYDRETFEKEEKQYYERKLLREAFGISGVLDSLDNMGFDLNKLNSVDRNQLLSDNSPITTYLNAVNNLQLNHEKLQQLNQNNNQYEQQLQQQ